MIPKRGAFWPRFYPAGLAVWLVGLPIAAVLVQVASGFALASEEGPMFRLGNGLLVLLGSACMLTAFIHTGNAIARATWNCIPRSPTTATSQPSVVPSPKRPNARGVSTRAATTVITKSEPFPLRSANVLYATSQASASFAS